jgi:uncharacterized protein
MSVTPQYSLKRLLVFFALTFIWSWACWLLAPLAKTYSNNVTTSLLYLGSFGPSLAALMIITVTEGPKGLRAWLSCCLKWRVGRGWLTLAFLSPLAVLTTAAIIHILLGGTVRNSPADGYFFVLIANFFLVFVFGGPLGEEFGWRGYALPALQQRMNWQVASLTLGTIWGLWHLPLFLFRESNQAQRSILIFFILIISTSVVYTWFFIKTKGSVVPALVLHTASNTWSFVVPIIPSDANQRPYLLFVSLIAFIAIFLLFHKVHGISPRFQASESGSKNNQRT